MGNKSLQLAGKNLGKCPWRDGHWEIPWKLEGPVGSN